MGRSLKYGGLNFLVVCLALFFAIKNYEVWTRPMDRVSPKRVAGESGMKPETPFILEKGNSPALSNSSESIAQRNIFSPERKDFPIFDSATTSKPIVRPQIVLYGVAISGDYQSATVSNLGKPARKEERETQTLKIGEKIGEYKLAKILPDRIAMEGNGDRFEVLLHDAKNPQKRMEVGSGAKLAAVASPQAVPAPAPLSMPFEAPKAVILKDKESLGKAAGMVLPQTPASIADPSSLPFNKYTYQMLPPSSAAIVRRGRVIYPPPGSSAQEPLGK
jgi:hypothetical protein